MIGALAIVVVGLVLSGVLSTIYLSLTDLTRSTLEDLVEGAGVSRMRRERVGRILDDVDGHARSVALVRVVCNLIVVVSLVWLFASLEHSLGWAVKSGGETASTSPGAAVGAGLAGGAERGVVLVRPLHGLLAVVAGASALWLVGVVLAQSLANHAAERIVLRFASVVRAAHRALGPVGAVHRGMDAIAQAVTGGKKRNKGEEIEAELLSVIDEGEREGQIDEDQAQMIEAVVKLRETTVGQIMTPRREIEALELTNNLGQITAFVRKARHSRIPVYRSGSAAGGGGLDDVIGFFYVKDLLKWLAGEGLSGNGAGGGRGFDLRVIMRPAMHVPETKTVRDLAHEFVQSKVHIAMVTDEYGGTAGLVTLEDIIEEVFGEIQDEYEKAEDEPPRIELDVENVLADIDARADMHTVNEALEPLDLRLPENEEEYDTLGGLVTTHLGRMPEVNESFEIDGAIVTVLETTPMRVVKVRVSLSQDLKERRRTLSEERPGAAQAETTGASPDDSRADPDAVKSA
ncbi:MAG: DUF21 domain-containing protein [Phycisphaeraceae bacterium]|nr:DUF21 domain-containing protein [Phycisphaeraceae bacterium]